MKTLQNAKYEIEKFKLPERYLRKEEVANLLSVTTRTVDNLMVRGVLPFIKMGARMVRFRLADINAHLESNCRVDRSTK